MAIGARLRAGLLRATVRRHRRILAASIATLLTSAILLGLLGVMRWRGRQALRSDTRTVIAQTAGELVRVLQSRRGTLTFVRDSLNRRADLSRPQLEAIGASAVQHTRHLLGTGVIPADQPPVWWATPQRLTSSERAELDREIVQRTRLRGIWRVPSTFAVTTANGRALLIMLEPLRAALHGRRAVIGVFDVKPLLADFFASYLAPHHPVQILDGTTLLFRSDDWKRTADGPAAPGAAHPDAASRGAIGGGIVAEHPIAVDAARWTVQMQPAGSRVAQTLSWFSLLLIALSAVAGLGVTALVWILASRAWMLQRAVARRTAALRHTTHRLRQLAVTDELTGLYNRRFFLQRWEWECNRARRYQRPLACLMVDVNGFKQVNDQLGHHAGDGVLRQVAQELKGLMRQSDILARFGGDEFIVALPETSHEQAASVAEKLREIRIQVPERRAGHTLPVSLSVGMSRLGRGAASPQDILQAADESLYAHKRRLKSADPEHAPTP